MNSIELNVTRKFRLVVMSKYLFPKYQFSQILKGENPSGKSLHITDLDKINLNIYINWFEFCFTHLLQAIKAKHPVDYQKQLMDDALMAHLRNGGHPIDFLYNEYRKIK